jgi:23S rRNA pseudouridine1911/1915/1917 synthase
MSWRVADTEDGERLDRFVSAHAELSRSRAKAMVEAGAVTVSGAVVERASRRLTSGETVVAELPADPAPPVAADPSVTITVVHEDDALIIVDKPAGLVVHPGAGRSGGTLADGLLARYPELEGVGPDHRPGLVHRLDRGTSGLLVVARTEPARVALVGALAERRIERGYQTAVWGRVGAARGIIDAPIGRSRRDPTKRAVVEDGRAARTHYEVEVRYDAPEPATLLACRLETGRTHQIRVHLAAIDHPIVADTVYGGARVDVGLDRPFLHARRLSLDHPVTGEAMEFTSALPPDLVAAKARFS